MSIVVMELINLGCEKVANLQLKFTKRLSVSIKGYTSTYLRESIHDSKYDDRNSVLISTI